MRIDPDSKAAGAKPPRLRSRAVDGLFVIAAVHALYFGRTFAVPVVVAVLMWFVLAPSVRWLSRMRLPAPIAAALVLGLVVAVAGGAIYRLAGPAAAWIDQVPRTLDRLETRVTELSGRVESVREATDRVEQMTTLGDEEDEPQQVEVAGTSLSDTLFQGTFVLASQLLFVVVLLYALLASGNLVIDKLVELVPGLGGRRELMLVARNTEKQISRYLMTVTLINALLGVVAGLAMYALGMPNPLLWGVIAGLFNFVPFVGALVTSGVLLLVAATEFNELGRVLAPPLVFLALTGIEAYFVTPTILSQRFTLNLVAVFLSLFFWGWLWGPAGALLAVPMLAALKIISDQLEPLDPLSRLLES